MHCADSQAASHHSHATCRSGGGGGTKGPSVIDKRNQELPCPYCERIFKQQERYRNHVQSKHADEAAAAKNEPAGSGDGDGPTTSANVAAANNATPGAGSGSEARGEGGAKGGVMTPGAKAGYYTAKSPTLLLQDQCRSDKRPKPRIKPQVRPCHIVMATRHHVGGALQPSTCRPIILLPAAQWAHLHSHPVHLLQVLLDAWCMCS